jgi:hypothetical protein
MTQTPASRQPPPTRHAGRRPIPTAPARTYSRRSKPGPNRVSARRGAGNRASTAPQLRQNQSAAATLTGWQHPMPTGATKSFTRPASPDNLARAGPRALPCTERPNQAPQMPDLSQADDPASVGRPYLGSSELDGELARPQDLRTGGMATLTMPCASAWGIRRCVYVGGHLDQHAPVRLGGPRPRRADLPFPRYSM